MAYELAHRQTAYLGTAEKYTVTLCCPVRNADTSSDIMSCCGILTFKGYSEVKRRRKSILLSL